MKKDTKKVYVNKPKNFDMLTGLLHESNFLHLLKGKNYDSLIDYIIKIAPFWHDENSAYSLPTIKKISEEINEKRVHSWLPKMVDDLIELNNEHPEYFNINNSKHLYCLHAKDSINELSINYNVWMNMALSEGQTFHWPFSRVRTAFEGFWIKSIHHRFSNGDLETDVYLEYGRPNAYREFLHDRAVFENKINHYQSYTTSEYEIDNLLRQFYR